jgi:hypothetical protein
METKSDTAAVVAPSSKNQLLEFLIKSNCSTPAKDLFTTSSSQWICEIRVTSSAGDDVAAVDMAKSSEPCESQDAAEIDAMQKWLESFATDCPPMEGLNLESSASSDDRRAVFLAHIRDNLGGFSTVSYNLSEKTGGFMSTVRVPFGERYLIVRSQPFGAKKAAEADAAKKWLERWSSTFEEASQTKGWLIN